MSSRSTEELRWWAEAKRRVVEDRAAAGRYDGNPGQEHADREEMRRAETAYRQALTMDDDVAAY
jgi:hypothetical protein